MNELPGFSPRRPPALPLRVARYAWAFPATIVGLAVAGAALVLGGRAHVVGGTLEVAGGYLPALVRWLPRRFRFVAITFGHVIIGTDHRVLRRVRAHERVHVRQYERWGALLFPLYLASSLWQLLRGRDPYFDNRFEREAFVGGTPSAQTPRRLTLVDADVLTEARPNAGRADVGESADD